MVLLPNSIEWWWKACRAYGCGTVVGLRSFWNRGCVQQRLVYLLALIGNPQIFRGTVEVLYIDVCRVGWFGTHGITNMVIFNFVSCEVA
jgi:hypothetical protein